MDGEQLEVISRLYERHAQAVHRYALRRSDPDTAEEVTAQVFLVAWRRRDALPEQPLPWLYGVARRVLAEQRRGASRRLRLSDRLQREDPGTTVSETEDPGRTVFGEELELSDDGLASALGQLSEVDREVLLLRYWEELEPAQVGRAMGCSRAAVAVRLHRARARLRRALEEQDGQTHRAQEDGKGHPCVERAESA